MYNSSMDYQVQSAGFEGPIHLLLQLIQERKLHVSEVSLALVTEDFLNYLADHSLSYADVSSFIVVAATLVLVKARSLLPQIELSDEEETSITDLTERIRQYEVVQSFSRQLAPYYGRSVSFERIWHDKTPVFAPDEQVTISLLSGTLREVLQSFPILEKLPEKAIRVALRLDQVIEGLRERISQGFSFHSREIMDKYHTTLDPVERRQAKVFAVVSFLAILELVKKGFGNVLQDSPFGDIELTSL